MKRTWLLIGLCALCLWALCACAVVSNPLVLAEATAVPGAEQALHTASASRENATELTATLFYRYLDLPALAGESRTLSVPRDESGEMAVIRALLEGPSAERVELRRLFGEGVAVTGVSANQRTLFVTLDASFLRDELPEDWQTREEDAEEAPLRRLLTVQSLVCTLTENFPYDSVQILINREDAAQGNTRLDRSYFLTGGTGPADLLTRDDSLILTPGNTAQWIARAWQEKDLETLYAFTASYMDYETRPVYTEFVNALNAAPTLADFSAGSDSVTEDGLHAVCAMRLELARENGAEEIAAYPLRMVRENGVWKATLTALKHMMLR